MGVTIKGLEPVIHKLTTLNRFNQWAREPMTKAVAVIHSEVAKYPKKASGAFSRLATPGQRRAYWARVRSGEISHRDGIGYVRTGSLGRSWTSKVTTMPNGIRGEVGNNREYAPFVQRGGANGQQPFHAASKWETDKTAIEKAEPQIDDLFKAAIDAVLNS